MLEKGSSLEVQRLEEGVVLTSCRGSWSGDEGFLEVLRFDGELFSQDFHMLEKGSSL